MSTPFRSHFGSQPHQEQPSSQSQRKQSSRIPTKPGNSNTTNKQSKAVQHVSRLAKRASRTFTAGERAEQSTNTTTVSSAPVTAEPLGSAPSKRMSFVQLSEVVSSERAPMSRHNGVLLPPPTLRTPSLVSGSSVSTFESPRSTGLRRKPSIIEQYAASRGNESTVEPDGSAVHRAHVEQIEAFENSILGISIPSTKNGGGVVIPRPEPKTHVPADAVPTTHLVTRDITPPVPNYAQSTTPSTRYTGSPFSHVPTPSSASSYSSAVVATSSTGTVRTRPQSPTRSAPPTTNRPGDRDSGRLRLLPVREASTSSSNSTVKPSEIKPAIPRKDVPRKASTYPAVTKTADAARPASRGKLTKERPRQASDSATTKSTPSIPPELAHLNVEQSQKSSPSGIAAPARPSRDGTPILSGMNAPSPVVQSDLPRLYTTYHKRTPSQETPCTMESPSFKMRFGLSPKGSSKQQSPRIDSAVSPPPAARAFARGPTPDAVAAELPRLTRKDSPAVGIVPSKSPRFGFFSRKSKTTDSDKAAEKPKRQPSKGPAAGTGHEGYGRFGMRSRSGSNSSSTGHRSPSAETIASNQRKVQPTDRKTSFGSKNGSKDGSDLDDFLRERLNPVVLRGSGSTVSYTASGSEKQTPSAPGSSNHSSLDSIPKPQLLPSAMDNVLGASGSKLPPRDRRTPSESSEDDVTTRYPTLAPRRSLTWLPQEDGKVSIQVPAPINTGIPSKNPSLDGSDVERSAWPQSGSSLPVENPFEGKEGFWLQSTSTEPEVKPGRKWNFFQRAQASPRGKGKEKVASMTESSSSVPYQSPYRGPTHYAILDSAEPVGLEEVERIMQETETSPEDSMSDNNAPPKVVPYERRHTGLLPPPPKPEYLKHSAFKARRDPPNLFVRSDSSGSTELLHAQRTVPHQLPHVVKIHRSPIIPEPKLAQHLPSELQPEMSKFGHTFHTPEMTPVLEDAEEPSPPRQPRLSPVGRIPKVISKRDRDRKLSDSSFSRPFAHTQPRPSVKPPGSLYTQIRELASPVESGSQPVSSASTISNGASGEHKSSVNTNPPSTSTNRTSMDIHRSGEFFSFPHRKDSEVSYSSSSGNTSVMAILAAQPPQEDDVWNEYNDFLDDHLTNRTSRSTASSLGAPFQYSTILYDSPAQLGRRLWDEQLAPNETAPPPRSQSTPAVLSVPQQIARFMQPSMSPLMEHSESGNHDRNRGSASIAMSNRTSLQEPKRSNVPKTSRSSIAEPSRSSASGLRRSSLSQASQSNTQAGNKSSLPRGSRSSLRGSIASSSRNSRASGHSRSASLPETNARNSQSSLTPSMRFRLDTQLLDIAEMDGNEQYAALQLRNSALETSKWLSFGRVLFSPAHHEMRLADEPRVLVIDGLGSDWSYYVAHAYPAATVYNLGPAPANGSSAWACVQQKPSSNHRHITHAAISDAFPFPKGFFTAVVFRFPPATTDQAYQACIYECKRVLRAGGHLEVAALDLDLMNMGNKSRKEVRGLKTRLQQRDRNVSLRNLSDFLVGLIGKRGFEEVQRCIVGVPVSGRIPRSQDVSSVSSGSSNQPVRDREEHHDQKYNLADLIEDARASQDGSGKNNDEDIAKMVAKVGRWWYSTCYEKTLLKTDNSIWNDHTVLRECQKQGTSFRLLLCYAQKPTQKRRTMSV